MGGKKNLKELMEKILIKEKEFLNETNLTESQKVRELKKIIESEVKANDN